MKEEIILDLDSKATQSVEELMNHYNLKSKAALFSKAIAVLKLVAHVNKTNGELFARKGSAETKIIVR